MAQLPPHGCVLSCAACTRPATFRGFTVFYFYLLDYVAICVFRIPYPYSCNSLCLRAPRRPVRPVSRHPRPQLPSARRSPLPVAGGSRAGATTRRARPSASGRGERLKSAARWQASTPHGTTTRGAPPSDAKYGTDSRGESAKARARGPSTPARGANRQRTAPLAARVEARGNGNGWGGPRAVGDWLPPNCSRRSAKIQKVWLSCVAR